MHSLPFCNRIACVLAERERSAPQALGNPLAMVDYIPTVERPLLEPPPRRAPAPASALLP
eukprot:1055487-Pleurochrysis_carterae.AAC.1